jgi:hypothetical protein
VEETDKEEVTWRLCSRITGYTGKPLETAVQGTCTRCKLPVWVDGTQHIPAYASALIRVLCIPCALHDPEMAPHVIPSIMQGLQDLEEYGLPLPYHVNEGDEDAGLPSDLAGRGGLDGGGGS